jgi:uncharacterized Tic20 family protein
MPNDLFEKNWRVKMEKNNNFLNQLLRQDGIDPFGVSDKERRDLRDIIEREQRRVRRMAWLVQGPLWVFLALMLLLCMSERLLIVLDIPFVVAWGAVVLLGWIILIPTSFRLLSRFKAKRERLQRLHKLVPEYAKQFPSGAIVLVSKREGKRVINWRSTGMLFIVVSFFSLLGTEGVYYLLAGRPSRLAVVISFVIAIVFVLAAIYQGLKTPVEDLREFHPAWKRSGGHNEK